MSEPEWGKTIKRIRRRNTYLHLIGSFMRNNLIENYYTSSHHPTNYLLSNINFDFVTIHRGNRNEIYFCTNFFQRQKTVVGYFKEGIFIEIMLIYISLRCVFHIVLQACSREIKSAASIFKRQNCSIFIKRSPRAPEPPAQVPSMVS